MVYVYKYVNIVFGKLQKKKNLCSEELQFSFLSYLFMYA